MRELTYRRLADIMNEIWQANPEQQKSYSELADAIEGIGEPNEPSKVIAHLIYKGMVKEIEPAQPFHPTYYMPTELVKREFIKNI